MKRISSLIIAAVLVCTASVSANERSFCKMSGTRAAVRGRAAGVGSEEVSLLLIHKDNNSIGYAAQTQTDSDGYYKFDFKFTKDNPKDYKVIINRAGEVINETVEEASVTETFFVDLMMDYDGRNDRLKAFLSECFASSPVKIMLAQYDSYGKLVSVKIKSSDDINDDDTLIVEDTSALGYIKGFAWSDIGKMQPLSEVVEYAPLNLQTTSEENTAESLNVACIGDSITWGYGTTKQYHSYISDEFNVTVQNLGISGSTITNFVPQSFIERVAKVNKETDLIMVFGGVNDRNANVPLGKYGDTEQDTFYGAAELLVKTIRRTYPESRLVLITPLNSPDAYTNSDLSIEDYANALIDVANKNFVPVLDAYHELDLTGYFPDNIHPNEEGHKLLANYIVEKLEEKNLINIVE